MCTERKIAVSGSPSIKLPPSRSISPAAPATKTASHTRSRLSRQSYPAPRRNVIEDTEEEEEPEIEEAEVDDEDDDHKLYCFCQKPSAGDVRMLRVMCSLQVLMYFYNSHR